MMGQPATPEKPRESRAWFRPPVPWATPVSRPRPPTFIGRRTSGTSTFGLPRPNGGRNSGEADSRGSGFMNPTEVWCCGIRKVSRNGLAGVLESIFPGPRATSNLAIFPFTNAAVRFRAMEPSWPWRAAIGSRQVRPRNTSGPGAGRTLRFNLGNLSADFTCLSDSLAYEYFRDAGVPAPRTAFARVFPQYRGFRKPTASWDLRDGGKSGRRVGEGCLRYERQRHLQAGHAGFVFGPWDPMDQLTPSTIRKTKITDAQKSRVIEVAQWVSHASDEDFCPTVR